MYSEVPNKRGAPITEYLGVGRKIPKIVINMYVGKGSYTVKIANLISESEPIIRIPTIFHLTYLLL